MTDKSEKNSYLGIVKQMVEEIKYGQITITLQDGKVIQIDQNKKKIKRLTGQPEVLQ